MAGTPFLTNANAGFGSPTVTIGGITYIVNGNYAPKKPTRSIERRDGNGDISDYQLRSELTTLQVTLQLATSATTVPARGVTFTASIGFGVTDELLVTDDVSPARPQGDFWVVDVSARGVAVVNN